MSILAQATNTIAEGEVMQLQNIKKWDLSEQEYRAVIASKTATLFAAACELSAVITHQDHHRQAMHQFGSHLGIAFQMMDDLLDYTANEAELGKHLGDDLAEGKMTLPLIHALQTAPYPEAQLIQSLLASSSQHSPEHLQTIAQFIHTHQGFDYTYQHIQHETTCAHAALSSLPNSAYKDALHQLVDFLIRRKY
jgi:octaprenyl-diphosphate synthase